MKSLNLITFLSLIFLYSCGSTGGNDEANSTAESEGISPVFGSFIDIRDNKSYKTVEIVGNTWLAENLNTTTFRNGDVIPEIKSSDEWKNGKTPGWCYYDNDEKNGKKYGRIYNNYAITDPRGLAPEGWHVPNYDEMMDKLGNQFGGNSYSSAAIRSAEEWGEKPYGDDKNKYNVSGFNLLAGGFRDSRYGFSEIGKRCEFAYIEETRLDGNTIVKREEPVAKSVIITKGDWHFTTDPNGSFSHGRYVRCIKDDTK